MATQISRVRSLLASLTLWLGFSGVPGLSVGCVPGCAADLSLSLSLNLPPLNTHRKVSVDSPDHPIARS